jgi:hypothetical protein
MCYINYHWNNTKIKSIQSKLFQCVFYTNKTLNLGHLVKVLWKHLNSTNTKGSPLCDVPFLVFSQLTFLFIKKTKSRSPSPPKTNLGFVLSSCWFIGLQYSSTSMFHTQNLTPNGFGQKIWLSQHYLKCPSKRAS